LDRGLRTSARIEAMSLTAVFAVFGLSAQRKAAAAFRLTFRWLPNAARLLIVNAAGGFGRAHRPPPHAATAIKEGRI
jgi:hypothetical protein